MKLLLTTLVALVGVLTFIEFIHIKAHREYEVDVHGQVKTFCWKNPETCRSFIN